MAFWDSVKNVANEAADALTNAANDVAGSAKEYNERSRLRRAISSEEIKLKGYYQSIGEKFVAANPDAPAGYAEQYNGIKTSKAEIERLKNELAKKEAVKK